MVNIVDDIARQARQGSVAAIIQILNDRLAEIGVRTRAVFADGVLQLLCEAATADLLEQSSLVDRLTQILEQLSPQNIRRVQINSRLVREHQLLWLEEISLEILTGLKVR
jgi:alpha-D-ribose 1-methylphosphonate 5-triphosphate synthase subunit PhnL